MLCDDDDDDDGGDGGERDVFLVRFRSRYTLGAYIPSTGRKGLLMF